MFKERWMASPRREEIMDVGYVSSAAVNAYQQTTAAAKQNTKTESRTNTGFSDTAAVYEKSSAADGKVTAKNTDRSAIIEQMKADMEARKSSMVNMVQDMMKQQGKQIGTADDVWKFLADGNFTVTEAAKKQAQEAISEDGYWGVKQTSDRILEFAKALSGDDVSKAKTLLDAFDKGFKEATKSWGKELPDISQQTYAAVHEKFNDWMNPTETE